MRGVAGGLKDFQPGGAEIENISFLEGNVVEFDRRPLEEMDGCPGARLQLHVAAHVIGVNMGFKNVGDFHSVGAGDVNVVLDIALGVHHAGYPGLRAADDIGQASHALNCDLLEIHSGFSYKSPVV